MKKNHTVCNGILKQFLACLNIWLTSWYTNTGKECQILVDGWHNILLLFFLRSVHNIVSSPPVAKHFYPFMPVLFTNDILPIPCLRKCLWGLLRRTQTYSTTFPLLWTLHQGTLNASNSYHKKLITHFKVVRLVYTRPSLQRILRENIIYPWPHFFLSF